MKTQKCLTILLCFSFVFAASQSNAQETQDQAFSAGKDYSNAMSLKSPEEVIDADGNVYSTVRIGNQLWFAGNLRTTKYNNGTSIPNITGNSDWGELTTGAYVWYNNDAATYKDAYGALYNWYAVETGNLCPAGWRVPTDADWTALTEYVGGISVAGGKLKSTHTTPDAHPRWTRPNRGATDEYGFSALPGGGRRLNGKFYGIGTHGFWWSSTEIPFLPYAWFRRMYSGSRDVGRLNHSEQVGFSVRCLRDLVRTEDD